MMLDWIGQVADFLRTIVVKAFPTTKETQEKDKQNAKTSWDEFVDREKKIADEKFNHDADPLD